MGCNTSKDSFQPAVDEAKEDSVKNGGERPSPLVDLVQTDRAGDRRSKSSRTERRVTRDRSFSMLHVAAFVRRTKNDNYIYEFCTLK